MLPVGSTTTSSHVYTKMTKLNFNLSNILIKYKLVCVVFHLNQSRKLKDDKFMSTSYSFTAIVNFQDPNRLGGL